MLFTRGSSRNSTQTKMDLFATRDIVFRFDATLDFLKFGSFGLLFVQMRFDLMIKMITLTPHVSQSDLREIC